MGGFAGHAPLTYLTTQSWCPQSDSNRHWTDFKSAASANWAMGAPAANLSCELLIRAIASQEKAPNSRHAPHTGLAYDPRAARLFQGERGRRDDAAMSTDSSLLKLAAPALRSRKRLSPWPFRSGTWSRGSLALRQRTGAVTRIHSVDPPHGARHFPNTRSNRCQV